MKIKINKELLEKVAEIARLKLSEEELNKFTPQFKEILDIFSKLDKVDTKKIEPAFQPLPLKNAWREDRAEKGLSQKQALANTKHKEKGFFKGPAIV